MHNSIEHNISFDKSVESCNSYFLHDNKKYFYHLKMLFSRPYHTITPSLGYQLCDTSPSSFLFLELHEMEPYSMHSLCPASFTWHNICEIVYRSPFSLLSTIPSHEYSTIYFSAPLLMDIYIISCVWLFWINLLWIICASI